MISRALRSGATHYPWPLKTRNALIMMNSSVNRLQAAKAYVLELAPRLRNSLGQFDVFAMERVRQGCSIMLDLQMPSSFGFILHHDIDAAGQNGAAGMFAVPERILSLNLGEDGGSSAKTTYCIVGRVPSASGGGPQGDIAARRLERRCGWCLSIARAPRILGLRSYLDTRRE